LVVGAAQDPSLYPGSSGAAHTSLVEDFTGDVEAPDFLYLKNEDLQVSFFFFIVTKTLNQIFKASCSIV
jgi:hypothetical protein